MRWRQPRSDDGDGNIVEGLIRAIVNLDREWLRLLGAPTSIGH
jgi:hypothetical protein